MNTKFTKSLLLVSVLSVNSAALASDFDVDGLYYNILSETDKTVEVTSQYSWSSYNYYSLSKAEIPESVTYNDVTYKVTAIGENAFFYAGISEASIPKTVTTIGAGAFRNSELTKITIGENVESISENAFNSCASLTNVTLGKATKTIGDNAFSNCSELEQISISENVTSIGNEAFSSCYKLKSYEVAEGNSLFSSENGVLFNKDKSTLIVYPLGKEDTSYEVPASVTTIGANAFESCKNLTSVTIPTNVTAIKEHAFDNCVKLSAISLPTSIKKIEGYTFTGCTALESVEIPDGVTSLGSNAFSYCSNLKTVTFSNTLDEIWSYAFYNCTSLKSVELPNSLTYMDNSVFSGCEGLTSVTFGNALEYIGDSSFSGCKGLTSIVLPNSLTSMGSSAFAGCSILKDVKLSTSLETLGLYAFSWCKALENITIPASVKTVGSSAFDHCNVLAKVVFEEKDADDESEEGLTISSYAFSDCALLKVVELSAQTESIDYFTFNNCDLDTVKCSAVTPPMVVNANAFTDNTYANAKLIVPSQEVYASANIWKKFTNIENMSSSAISTINSDDVRVSANNSTITIEGLNNAAPISVYTMNGQMIYNGCKHSISVANSGLYIVRTAGKAYKVMVK